jgi:hypothetical protein
VLTINVVTLTVCRVSHASFIARLSETMYWLVFVQIKTLHALARLSSDKDNALAHCYSDKDNRCIKQKLVAVVLWRYCPCNVARS